MLEFMNDFRHILDPKVRSKRGGSKLGVVHLEPKVELPTSRREKNSWEGCESAFETHFWIISVMVQGPLKVLLDIRPCANAFANF